jgi:hypothetical protein
MLAKKKDKKKRKRERRAIKKEAGREGIGSDLHEEDNCWHLTQQAQAGHHLRYGIMIPLIIHTLKLHVIFLIITM